VTRSRRKHDRVAGPNSPTTRSFGLREPGTIVCRCWNLRRRGAIRSWSATDQAIACPCQVARGGVTRQGITSLVEWMVQALTLAN